MNRSTIRLFDQDTYQREFDARVLSCEPSGDAFAVILDRTAFYPEGGGQPADQGILDGQPVLDVREKPEGLLHILGEPLAIGAVVQGTIDWAVRFERMQHHSGEHIVSGLIKQQHGFDNVGFHMGRDAVTIDFNGQLTDAMLETLERQANQVIYQNVPVRATYPTDADLAMLDYRSKKALTGPIRIVTIPDIDTCACCGTHVRYSGEIGLIRLIKAEKYKGGTRVTLLCGAKALQDYREQTQRVQTIATGLSTSAANIVPAVERLREELASARNQNQDLKHQIWSLEAPQAEHSNGWVIQFKDDLTADDLRSCCQIFGQQTNRSIVLSRVDANDRADGSHDYRYAMFAADGDIRSLAKAFNSQFAGRGGGSANLVQGTACGKKDDIVAFFGQSGQATE